MLKKILCCLVSTIFLSSYYNTSNAQDDKLEYSVNAVVEQISSESFMNVIITPIQKFNEDFNNIEDVIDFESMIDQLESIKNHGRLNVYFNNSFNESIPGKFRNKIGHDLLYQNWQFKNTGFKIVDVLYDENRNINGFVMECNVDNIHLRNNN